MLIALQSFHSLFKQLYVVEIRVSKNVTAHSSVTSDTMRGLCSKFYLKIAARCR